MVEDFVEYVYARSYSRDNIDLWYHPFEELSQSNTFIDLTGTRQHYPRDIIRLRQVDTF